MENRPLISVIILSYNTKAITLECLDKLTKSQSVSLEIIVIENGTDGTDKIIKKLYPQIKIIKPKLNTGFAIGNNLGLKAANPKSKYLLCLNSDAFVNPDTLDKCLNFFATHPDCDVLGCKLVFADGRLQPSAGFLPNPQNIYSWMVWAGDSVHPQSPSFFAKDIPVEWVMGAFMLMKRQVYDVTKGFDENYFMYGEEIEWFQRIKNAGFTTWYTPSTSITHLDKASSKGDSINAIIKEIAGLKYFILKYYSADWYWLKWIVKFGMFWRSLYSPAHKQALKEI